MHRALELALEHGAHAAALRGYVNGAFMAWLADDRLRALELSRAGVQLASKIGDRDSQAALGGWKVAMLVQLGRWDEGVEEEQAVLELRQPAAIEMLGLYLARGELEVARERLRMAKAAADPNDVQDIAAVAATGAEMALTEGRPADALQLVEEAMQVSKELGLAHGALTYAIGSGLEAAFALGDDAKLDELLGIIERQSPGQRTGLLRSYGARFSALRAARAGDVQTAEAAFAAAARILREIEVPFELAVVLLEHAEWLVSEGRAADAQPLLDEARTTFEQLRATPWLERVAAVTAARPALVD
jgi:tetratricopeptide (TPR) repeat protein